MTVAGLRQWTPDAPRGEWMRASPALQGHMYLTIDLETGGLDPLHCGITEIGAVAARHDGAWGGYAVANTFCILLRPTPGLTYTDQALAVQGRTLADLRGGMEESEAIAAFYAWVRCVLPQTAGGSRATGRPSPWAHNARFDKSFLLAAHDRYNAGALPDASDYEFCPFSIDFRCTQSLWRELRKHGVHMTRGETLDTVLAHYGIATIGARRHTAVDDALLTAQAVCCLMRDWREVTQTAGVSRATQGWESATVRAIRAGSNHRGMGEGE